MSVELTVAIGEIGLINRWRFDRNNITSVQKKWFEMRDTHHHKLRGLIWDAVYELLGFDCDFKVNSVRYGNDGVVWVKVTANAAAELNYP